MRGVPLLALLLACSRHEAPRAEPPPAPADAAAPVAEDAAAPGALMPADAAPAVADCLFAKRALDARPAPFGSGSPAKSAACDAAKGRHDAVVARAMRTVTDAQPGSNASKGFACAATPDGGAWATEVTSLAWDGSSGKLVGRLVLERLGPGGARLAAIAPAPIAMHPPSQHRDLFAPKDNYELSWSDDGGVGALVVYDWNGDGEPEVFLDTWVHHHEAGSWHRGRIWTFFGGRITPYGPAARLFPDDVVDADGDGVPDVVYHEPFAAGTASVGAGFDYLAEGPALLAHARPDGTFALADDVARSAARCGCPSAPSVAIPANVENEDTAGAIACARLWGEPSPRLVALVDAACPDGAAPLGAMSPCVQRDMLRAFARATPPLTLP